MQPCRRCLDLERKLDMALEQLALARLQATVLRANAEASLFMAATHAERLAFAAADTVLDPDAPLTRIDPASHR